GAQGFGLRQGIADAVRMIMGQTDQGGLGNEWSEHKKMVRLIRRTLFYYVSCLWCYCRAATSVRLPAVVPVLPSRACRIGVADQHQTPAADCRSGAGRRRHA